MTAMVLTRSLTLDSLVEVIEFHVATGKQRRLRSVDTTDAPVAIGDGFHGCQFSNRERIGLACCINKISLFVNNT